MRESGDDMTSTIGSLQVGDTLPPLALAAINRTTLALYAGASGDHNPIHIDIDFARRARMPDVFAHGMLSMAYLGRLLTNWVPQRQIRQFNARFVGITHLGNSIHCSGKVVQRLEQDGEPLLRLEIQSANQFGETKILGDALIAI
jgi:acyl dehydratase